jgi:SpoOM protein
MGLWGTIKGWFNIGGVRVKVQGVTPMLPKTGNLITGKVLLSTKTDKEVKRMTYKLLLRRTSGRGEERKTKDHVLAQSTQDQPFALKKGEAKTIDFSIPYSLEKSLKDMGGVLGAIGKIGAFAAKETDEYFVVAECGVKGAAFSPTGSVPVRPVD